LKFIARKLVGNVDNSAYPLITVDIQAILTTPANAIGLVVPVRSASVRGAKLPANPSRSGARISADFSLDVFVLGGYFSFASALRPRLSPSVVPSVLPILSKSGIKTTNP
jgi:hypothetical protein